MRTMGSPFIRGIRGPSPGQDHIDRITRILYSTEAATIKSYGSGLSYRVPGGLAGRTGHGEEAAADRSRSQITRKQ